MSRSDTYIHITKVGALLKDTSERRMFFAWSLATYLAEGENYVSKDLILKELNSRAPRCDWKKTMSRVEIPFFRESKDRLYFVKQKDWLSWLMNRAGEKNAHFPRHIRPADELSNYKTFIYAMIRAAAENPMKSPGPIFQKAMKSYNKKGVIAGRSRVTIAEQVGLNPNYVSSIVSKFEKDNPEPITIDRYIVVHFTKSLNDALTFKNSANFTSQGEAYYYVKNKRKGYEVRKKLASAYFFTGLKVVRALTITSDYTLHEYTDNAPGAGTTTPVSSVGFKVKAVRGLTTRTRIIEEQMIDYRVPYFYGISDQDLSLNLRYRDVSHVNVNRNYLDRIDL